MSMRHESAKSLDRGTEHVLFFLFLLVLSSLEQRWPLVLSSRYNHGHEQNLFPMISPFVLLWLLLPDGLICSWKCVCKLWFLSHFFVWLFFLLIKTAVCQESPEQAEGQIQGAIHKRHVDSMGHMQRQNHSSAHRSWRGKLTHPTVPAESATNSWAHCERSARESKPLLGAYDVVHRFATQG